MLILAYSLQLSDIDESAGSLSLYVYVAIDSGVFQAGDLFTVITSWRLQMENQKFTQK